VPLVLTADRTAMARSLPTLGRRTFAGGVAAGASAITLGHMMLAGEGRADNAAAARRFIFFYVPGGWDHLLFLDPRSFELEVANDAAYASERDRTLTDTRYWRAGASFDVTQYFGRTLNVPNGAPSSFALGPVAVRRDAMGAPLGPVNLVT